MERRLAKDGIRAVVISDLARELGMSTKTLYRLYPSKDELVLAALKHLAAKRAAAAVREIGDLRAGDDPLGAILDLLWELHDGPIFVATVELWWQVERTRSWARGREVRVGRGRQFDCRSGAGRAGRAQQIDARLHLYRHGRATGHIDLQLRRFRPGPGTSALEPAATNLRRIADPALEDWAANRT